MDTGVMVPKTCKGAVWACKLPQFRNALGYWLGIDDGDAASPVKMHAALVSQRALPDMDGILVGGETFHPNWVLQRGDVQPDPGPLYVPRADASFAPPPAFLSPAMW